MWNVISFYLDDDDRRVVSSNVENLAFILLFLKKMSQRRAIKNIKLILIVMEEDITQVVSLLKVM